MSLAHSPRIVTNGLVFYYDMNNPKSFKGKPTTNLITNASTMSGFSAYYRTTALSTFKTEFGTTGYRFQRQPSWNGCYQSFTNPGVGTYTFSAYYRFLEGSTDCNGGTVYFAFDGTAAAVGVDKTKINQWQRISVTVNITNASSGCAAYLISYGGNDNGTGNPDYSSQEVTMPQIEAGSVATPFVDGTRSSSSNIINAINDKTSITAYNLVYASDNTLSFNGSNSYVAINPTLSGNSGVPFTYSAWAKTSTASGWQTVLGTAGTYRQIGFSGTAFYYGGNAGGGNILVYGGNIVANTWYHLALTYDGTTAYGYLNGVQTTGNIGSNGGTIGNNYLGTYSPSGELLNGSIACASIYNRALTASEVLQNFNALRGRFGI